MSLNLAYQLELQITNPENVLAVQANPTFDGVLPTDEKDDLNVLLDAGATDVKLPMVNADGMDLILLIPDKDAVFKLGAVDSYPLPCKAGKFFLVHSQSVAGVWASNPSTTSKLNVRFIQAITRPPA